MMRIGVRGMKPAALHPGHLGAELCFDFAPIHLPSPELTNHHGRLVKTAFGIDEAGTSAAGKIGRPSQMFR